MQSIEDIDFTQLSPTERIQLAQALLDSVLQESHDELLTDEQMRELDRRLAALDNGTMQCQPWPQVRDDLLGGLEPTRRRVVGG